MQNSYSKEQVVYAGFWVRLAAYMIDSVVVAAGLLVVRLLMAGLMSAVRGTALGGNLLFDYTLKDLIIYACGVLYFIICTYYTGTTLGKRAMNLMVIGTEENGKLKFFDVLYRETVGRFLSGFVVGVGYLMIGLDKEKKGLHDILCNTRVLYAKKVKIYPQWQNQASFGPQSAPPAGPYRMAPGGYAPPVPPDRPAQREE